MSSAMIDKKFEIFTGIFVLFLFSACSKQVSDSTSGVKDSSISAYSELKPLSKGNVSGELRLTENPEGGVLIEGEVRGLPANSKHGFHIHEVGDCSSEDGSSAGGHFNPTQVPHGDIENDESHVGDLGNITSNAEGVARVYVLKKTASLRKGPSSVMGKSFIVHSNADDLVSQPTGAAGGRIACGVIQTQSSK